MFRTLSLKSTLLSKEVVFSCDAGVTFSQKDFFPKYLA